MSLRSQKSFLFKQLTWAFSLLVMLAVYAPEAQAQIVRSFTSRFTRNTPGDIELVGNSVLTCPPGATDCAAVQTGALNMGDVANNNNHVMTYIDVDSDATTFNSSSALVSLPQNARVLWAGLYWGGRTRIGSEGTGAAAPNPAAKNTVKLRSPTTGGYASITASTCDDATGFGNDGLTGDVYQCFAQVTNNVPSDGNGTYTVANVQSGTGKNRFGGWGLVIVYEDPSQPLRNLVVYDGFGLVLDQGMMGSVSINLSGFRSPASGNVYTRIGAIAYEGDQGAGGDSFRINNTPIGDAFNSASNFFNAGISRLGANITSRSPAYVNNLGFDLKLVEVTNILANNSTSATLKLDTSGDNYFPGVVTFGTILYAPDMRVTKTAQDVNGAPVTVGDILEYTITVRNDGEDAATQVNLEDIIPAGTTYVAGSGSIDGTLRTDAADSDPWTYDAINNSLLVNLGSGATSTQGGSISFGQETVIRFRVKIREDLAEGDRIENQAVVAFVTATLGIPTVVISDGDPFNPGADGTITIVENVPKNVMITAPAEGDTTLQRRPVIRGTATPNVTIILTINGMMVSVTSDAQGNWSYTPNSDLPLGSVTVTATVQNSTAMDSVTFTIAESGVEITSPSEGEITDDFTPTITGMATPGATVQIVIDGGTPVTVVADANGNWTYTPTTDLTEGSHTVVVTIPGTSAMDSVTFVISDDVVAITSPMDGGTATGRTPTITGTANPGATVEVSINGGAPVSVVADANGNWTYTPANDLPLGDNTVTAANGTASDSATFTVVNDPGSNNGTNNGTNNGNNNGTNNGTNNGNNGGTPIVTIDSPIDGSQTSNPPTITGTATPGSTVVIIIDGEKAGEVVAGDDGSWMFTPDDEIAPGDHTIEAVVTIGDKSDSDSITVEVLPAANRIVRGGACTSTGTSHTPSSPGAMLLWLIAPLGAMLMRRKKKALAALIGALGALTLSAEASAQEELTSFQVEHFEPLPSQPLNILNIASSDTLRHLEPSFGMVMHWVNDPIQYSNPDGSDAEKVIRNQLKAELNVALGLFDLVELGLVAPFVAYQNGDDLIAFGQPGQSIQPAALADFRLVPKVTILPAREEGGLGIAALIPMYIPIGDEGSFNSDGSFRLEPRLAVDWRHKGSGFHISGNVAYQLLRQDRAVSNFVNGDMLRLGLGVRIPTPLEQMKIIGSAFGSISFEEARAIDGVDPDELNKSRPMELLGALEYGFTRSIFGTLGAGAGVTRGVGSPDFRILAGINYAPAADLPPAIPDTDGDGYLDPDDQCPLEPEDFDQFEDQDGCPDPDNDKDTILDVDDQCPMDPEDLDGFEDENGCPDPDNDQDTLLDINDTCPNEPEDFDGFQDEDGCPDPDNDEDGILDVNDQCPLEPELKNGVDDEDGCPEKDTDKDGIIDPLDQCPTEPETYNGIKDDDGCPDGKQTVILTETEIKILEKVFFDTDKATIKKVSFPLLDTVVTVLKQNPQVTRIRIEGHTDDMGKDDYNLQLSKERAASVRQYLTDHGIDAARLESEGYGEEVPLCKEIPESKLGKRTKDKAINNCRADNRRVEFKIVEISGKRIQASDTVKVEEPQNIE